MRAPRLLAIAGLLVSGFGVLAQGPRFVVSCPKEILNKPFTGRVVVYLSKGGGEPRFGPNWFRPQPMISARFEKVEPGQGMTIDAKNGVAFPPGLATWAPSEYTVQAVIDLNLGGRTIGGSAGNLYSKPVVATIDPAKGSEVTLVCDQVVGSTPFVETDGVKEVRIESKLLSAFYSRPTFMSAAVGLPKGYDSAADRRYPIYYEVPGFGGGSRSWSGRSRIPSTDRAGEKFLVVLLDPNCPTGHSVFADSANNGPWGKALTTELIPEIERRFKAVGEPWARYVGGHSSGGWSSLWLQVTYPDVFGGCWSTAPDPVDFRQFQTVDIYQAGANAFKDASGKDVPIARFGDTVAITAKQFSDMERPIRGEQLGSFEAVFSPKGPDGEPAKLWDRDSGAIDPKVAEAWKAYDIGLILKNRWETLGPKLDGKVHVYMGDQDTFYLDGAVRLLQADLKDRNPKLVVEIVPGDHGSMMTSTLRQRIDGEMAAKFRAGKPKAQ